MIDISPNLSVSAADRAEAMLPSLTRELATGVQRRRMRQRVLGACAMVVVIAGAAVAVSIGLRNSAPIPAPLPLVEAPVPTASPTPNIEIVRSLDAPSIEIVRGTPQRTMVAISTTVEVDYAQLLVNDRELLDLLNDIGRPSGLVRANGRVWLTAAVTDEEIEKHRGG